MIELRTLALVSTRRGYLTDDNNGNTLFPLQDLAIRYANSYDAVKAMAKHLAKEVSKDGTKYDEVTIHFIQAVPLSTIITDEVWAKMIDDEAKEIAKSN